MHAPYRIASPPEPIRTEEADDYEKTLVEDRSRDRLLHAGMAVAALTVATIGVMAVANLSHHDRHEAEAKARMDARVASARATIVGASGDVNEAQADFDAALLGATRSDAPPSTSACNVEIAPSDRLGARAAFPLLVADPDDNTFPSPSVGRLRADVRRAEELLNTGYTSEAILYADALAEAPASERLVRDVVLVAKRRVPPTRTSSTTFTPGVLEGTAYLYDFRQRAVICAGEIHAESSRAIEYSYNDGALAIPKAWEHQAPRLDQTLDSDLDAQVARAIAAPGALRAITR